MKEGNKQDMSHGWPFYEGILSTDLQKEGKILHVYLVENSRDKEE